MLARKRFGQHFLHDRGVIERIVAAIGVRPEDHLVEIGPGRGALTELLLASGVRLDVIEIDRDLAPLIAALGEGAQQLRVHCADALKFDFRELCNGADKLRIVGNLPYNISTPLLFHLLKAREVIEDMHFMLQKEVVERLSARPGNKNYGRLSVMVQVHCKVEALFTVGAGAFIPPPKVESAVVRLRPYPTSTPFLENNAKVFANLVTAAFGQRRKTLANGLRTWLAPDRVAALGIDPQARAETLTPEEFIKLAQASLENHREN